MTRAATPYTAADWSEMTVSRSAGRPYPSTKMISSTAGTTMVLAVDSTMPRRLLSPSSRDRRADRSGRPASGRSCTLGLDRGDAGEVLQPLRGQLGQRPVALQRGQCLVHAGH